MGVPPSKFLNELDVLKAETMLVVLKLLTQVTSVDPTLLFTSENNSQPDSQLMLACFQFWLQILDTDYPIDEGLAMRS